MYLLPKAAEPTTYQTGLLCFIEVNIYLSIHLDLVFRGTLLACFVLGIFMRLHGQWHLKM